MLAHKLKTLKLDLMKWSLEFNGKEKYIARLH